MGTLPSSISLYDNLPFLVHSEEGLPPLILSLWEPSRPRSVLMGAFPPPFGPHGNLPAPVQSLWEPSLPRSVQEAFPLILSLWEPFLPRSVLIGAFPPSFSPMEAFPPSFFPHGNLPSPLRSVRMEAFPPSL